MTIWTISNEVTNEIMKIVKLLEENEAKEHKRRILGMLKVHRCYFITKSINR